MLIHLFSVNEELLDHRQSALNQWSLFVARDSMILIRPSYAASDWSVGGDRFSRLMASDQWIVGMSDQINGRPDCVCSVSDSLFVPFSPLPPTAATIPLFVSPLIPFVGLPPQQRFDAALRRPWRLRPRSS